MTWPCSACGRMVPAWMGTCPNCGGVRGAARPTLVSQKAPEPPLRSDAERARADAVARRLLAQVGEIGEDG